MTTWPPVTHQDLQDAVTSLRSPVLVKQTKTATGAAFATLAADTWSVIPFPAYPTEDIAGGAWDLAASTWQVPATGIYDCAATTRMTDAAAARNVGLAISTSSVGGGDAVWRNQGGNRDVMIVRRIDRFTAGDLLRVIVYSDGATYPIMGADFTIIRVGG